MRNKFSPTRFFFFLAALGGWLTVCAPLLQAEDRMVPGNWEFTMTTDGSSHTAAHCVTVQEASEVNGDSSSGRAVAEKKAAGRCTVKSFTVQGSSVTYSIVCGSRTISSKAVYHGDTYEGVLTTTTEGKVVTTQVKARRVGSCP